MQIVRVHEHILAPEYRDGDPVMYRGPDGSSTPATAIATDATYWCASDNVVSLCICSIVTLFRGSATPCRARRYEPRNTLAHRRPSYQIRLAPGKQLNVTDDTLTPAQQQAQPSGQQSPLGQGHSQNQGHNYGQAPSMSSSVPPPSPLPPKQHSYQQQPSAPPPHSQAAGSASLLLDNSLYRCCRSATQLSMRSFS